MIGWRRTRATGVELIAAERQRQVEVEGYEPDHDAGHADEALALAACAYATPHTARRWRVRAGESVPVPSGWPWAVRYWKPSPEDRVRELVKAGALIAAEIDRLLTRREVADAVRDAGYEIRELGGSVEPKKAKHPPMTGGR